MKLAGLKNINPNIYKISLESRNAEHIFLPTNFYTSKANQWCQQSDTEVNTNLCTSLQDEASSKLALIWFWNSETCQEMEVNRHFFFFFCDMEDVTDMVSILFLLTPWWFQVHFTLQRIHMSFSFYMLRFYSLWTKHGPKEILRVSTQTSLP